VLHQGAKRKQIPPTTLELSRPWHSSPTPEVQGDSSLHLKAASH